ncbi:hypothetical protein SAMN05444161_4176 [Rhizobiales bacterium GAS191]|nr:hypothetical protein SAMN05444161_4176 [Rhizobiales bacterium GAS191]
MSLRRLSSVAAILSSGMLLSGCATPVEAIRSSADGGVSDRERIAIALESSPEYGPVGWVGHLQKATIAGPFETTNVSFNGKRGGHAYCVRAIIEDKIFGSEAGLRWSEVPMTQDGPAHWTVPEKFNFYPRLWVDGPKTLSVTPNDCANRDMQPFPELEAARERRLAKSAQ